MRRDLSPSPLFIALIGALAAGVAACPGSLKDPERFAAPTDGGAVVEGIDVPQEIFVAKCGSSTCHGVGAAAGLDLVSEGLLARLADVESPNCAGRKLVDTGTVTNSLLLEKVTAMPACNSAMPLGTTGLSEGEYEAIRAWIVSELGMSAAQGLGR